MGQSLQWDILELLAVSIRANREALATLRGEDSQYLRNTISRLTREKMISVSKTPWWSIRLTSKGVALLAEINEPLADFYLRYSCNNCPGGNPTHKRAQCKASEVVALAKKAGVLTGVEKPARGDIGAGKLRPEQPALYLMKELKFEEGQRVGRAQISRATAVLLSRGISALVYNVQGDNLTINRAPETSANYHAAALRLDVCEPQAGAVDISRSIIVGYNYDVALGLIEKPDELGRQDSERKTKTLHTAIKDRAITKTDMLYLPLNRGGVMCLQLLMHYRPSEIQRLVFTEAEIAAAKQSGRGEAVVKGLQCFELVTMNLSKLLRVKEQYEAGVENVGFVCLESQADFVKRAMQTESVPLRIIKDDAIKKLLSQ